MKNEDFQDGLDGYSEAYIRKVMESFSTETSAAWQEFRKHINPRWRSMLERAFKDGKLGHRFRRLTFKETNLLLWAMDLHPGLTFSDDDGYCIGATLCPCGPCQQRTIAFVMETGVELHAQQKGDLHYVRLDDNIVHFEECELGESENRAQLQIVDLAGRVAQAVAEKVTQRVKEEVARQLAVFFKTQASATASANRQEMLIRESFRQQSDMLRTEPEELQ